MQGFAYAKQSYIFSPANRIQGLEEAAVITAVFLSAPYLIKVVQDKQALLRFPLDHIKQPVQVFASFIRAAGLKT